MLCDEIKFNSEEDCIRFHKMIFYSFIKGGFSDNEKNYKIGKLIYSYQEVRKFVSFYLNNYASENEKNFYYDYLRKIKTANGNDKNGLKIVNSLEQCYYDFLAVNDLKNYDYFLVARAKEYNDKYAHTDSRILFDKKYLLYLMVNENYEFLDRMFYKLYMKSINLNSFLNKIKEFSVSYEDASSYIENFIYKYSNHDQRVSFIKAKRILNNDNNYNFNNKEVIDYDGNSYFNFIHSIDNILMNNDISEIEKKNSLKNLIKLTDLSISYTKEVISNYVEIRYCMHDEDFHHKRIDLLRSVFRGGKKDNIKDTKDKEDNSNKNINISLYHARVIVMDLIFKYNGNIAKMANDLMKPNYNESCITDIIDINRLPFFDLNKSKEMITDSLHKIKKEDPETYEIYDLVILQKQNDIVNKMVNLINEFFDDKTDFLNYFLEINLPYDSLYYLANNYCSNAISNKVKLFINNKENKIDIMSNRIKSQILNMTNYISLLDSNGKAIPNTMHKITKEEINAIFDFIDKNKIPLSEKIFAIVKRRWFNGEIDLMVEKGFARTIKK